MRGFFRRLRGDDEEEEGAALPVQSLWETGTPPDPPCRGERPRPGHVHDARCASPLPTWYVADETPAVLAGRLEGVIQERDALRATVRQLLEQRDLWVQFVQRVMAERDALRANAKGDRDG